MKQIIISEPCVGYLWKSNQPQPEIISDKQICLDLNENENPFIIEGFLYVENKYSCSIKYVDGIYIVNEYKLDDLASVEYTLKEFIPNFLKEYGIKKIKFRQYWEKKEDGLCEGMDVLTPSAFVFVGFLK